MSGDESMNGMFSYDVQVLCDNGDIPLGPALNTSMTITVPLTNGGQREFNGLITRFSRVGQIGRFFLFRLQLHPWLWLLSRNSDLRIFQNRSVLQIVERIFHKYPLNSFDKTLGEYKARDFLVQYRETDLNFVSRLFEDQGIACHYIHTLGHHKLMLTDTITGRVPAPGYEKILLQQPTKAASQESFVSWNVSQEIQPDAYALRDFDYRSPLTPLVAQRPPIATADFQVSGEIYDYPGNYPDQKAGDRLVDLRREQGHAYYETFQGSGPVRGVGAGNIFSLTGPLVAEPKRKYLITRAHYEIRCPPPEGGGGADLPESFTCSINAVDSTVAFRLPRLTPIPVVQGPQTATVVDPKKLITGDNEIWTDNLGRVLVEFHWERAGAMTKEETQDNEDAPCWLRVAELWAGTGFGTVFTPRLGQEVIVEFLEGNPDRPIITGRLYNGTHKPPYLDEMKVTQSGIRTRSTPKGNAKTFNELRFDDKLGEEEVYIQAEKNQNNHVKQNRSATVGASDSVSVGGDRSVDVTGNLSVTVKGHGKKPIHSNYDVTGKHQLKVSDCIDLIAENHIKLTVGDTYIEITKDSIKLHAKGGGEITVDPNIEAHSNGKSQLLLNANAKMYGEADATVEGKANALITSKLVTAKGSDLAKVESKEVSVKGDQSVTVEGGTTAKFSGGGSKITATGAGIDAVGTVINLNG